MFVVMGATGNTGGVVADSLIAQGKRVRVVVRSAERGTRWAVRGAEVAMASADDAEALARAFAGAEGVYLMNPPGYALADPLGQAERNGAAMAEALRRSKVPHAVVLSSLGAATPDEVGIIASVSRIEAALRDLPVTVLRAAYFMENWASGLAAGRTNGVLPSLLQPLDRLIPMVSVADIGAAAAGLLVAGGPKLVELVGPEDYSATDAAEATGVALARPVQAVAVPREQWVPALTGNGFSVTVATLFQAMMHGIAAGRVAPTIPVTRGRTTLVEAMTRLVG